MNSLKNHLTIALAALLLCCAATSGCQSHGKNSELLERELRCQEDRIFQLEDELDEMAYALEASRRENSAIKKESTGGDKGAGGQFAPGMTAPPTTSAPQVDAPEVSAPSMSAPIDAPPGDEAPRFRFVPKPRKAPATPSVPSQGPNSEEELPSPDLIEPGIEAPSFQPTSHEVPVLSGDPTAIKSLAINRQLTGGWNANGHVGDEGILVAFMPRDANNQPIEAAGAVSIAVLDPSQTGGAARVARWEFTTDEAALNFSKGPIGRGFQFELPWPSEPPTSRDLRLFVRLTTPDGRKVEADAKIRVALCDGWETKKTAAATEQQDPVAATPEPAPAVAEQAEPPMQLEPIPMPQEPVRRPAKRMRTGRRPNWGPNR